MSEEEWLNCTDPQAMLEFLGAKASERKCRLFCCACCRRVGMSRARRKAVDIAERFADGKAGWWKTFWGEFLAFPPEERGWATIKGRPEQITAHITIQHWRKTGGAASAASSVALVTRSADPPLTADEQSNLLRDIFDNTVCPVTLDPRWLSSTVIDLARTIYEERAWERMPILADALMDAGCDSEESSTTVADRGRM